MTPTVYQNIRTAHKPEGASVGALRDTTRRGVW